MKSLTKPSSSASSLISLKDNNNSLINQGCTDFAKNQIFGLEIKELASLKQLLFLSILQNDFLTQIH